MKRIITLAIVFTIALASVCWANEIVGVWKFTGPDAKAESEEDVQTLEGVYEGTEKYLSFNEDGRAATTNVVDNQLEYKIGTWIQLTPEYYLFSYTFYSDKLKEDLEIEDIISIVDGSLRLRQFDSGDTYLYEVYEKIE